MTEREQPGVAVQQVERGREDAEDEHLGELRPLERTQNERRDHEREQPDADQQSLVPLDTRH
ncbi:hypothetical protein BRD20_01345 [Halobacteriales archaeon SW_8_65_20]|nr:MAG: hypothetical protein BRD20_01345 [Halobacteriales archaeon SW_8_65_20]